MAVVDTLNHFRLIQTWCQNFNQTLSFILMGHVGTCRLASGLKSWFFSKKTSIFSSINFGILHFWQLWASLWASGPINIESWRSSEGAETKKFWRSVTLRMYGSIQKQWRPRKSRKSVITHVTHVWRFFRFDIRNQHRKLPLSTKFERVPTNFIFFNFFTQSSSENFVRKSIFF